MKLSAVIITKNEEGNILDCIESVSVVSEIVIIDDYSIDRTLEVVKSLKNDKIKIFQHKLDDDFSRQRNYGISKTTGDWILFIDSDERVSKELMQEILASIEKASDTDGFFIKRQDVMWGRKLQYGETGNIKFLRLARKDAGEWYGKVHEQWRVGGKTKNLRNSLVHYPHQSVAEFLSEVSFYSTLRAQELHSEHKKVTLWQIILYPKAKFLVNFVIKLGFLDGIPGFITAIMMSLHSFLVRSKLWLLNQK